MQKKLGENLLAMLEQIVALMEVTTNPAQLDELEKLRVRLGKQIAALVDKAVDAASKEYQDAQKGLEAASQSAEKAIQGLESVANVINTIAQAVELVAKVAAA
jgi:uncharacterized protein YukE